MENKKWSRNEIEKLIVLFQEHENLYNINHKYYIDRTKRSASLNLISEQLTKDNPKLTTDVVKNKITTLRNQYQKEFRRMKYLKKSGAGADDVYEPKLWCFNQLNFLETHCTTRASVSNINTDDASSEIENKEKVEYRASSKDEENSFETITNDAQLTSGRNLNLKSGSKRVNVAKELSQNVADLKKMFLEKEEKEYAWLGKQVVSEINRMHSSQMKLDTAWAIQKILHENRKKDLEMHEDESPSISNIQPKKDLEMHENESPSTSNIQPKIELEMHEDESPSTSNIQPKMEFEIHEDESLLHQSINEQIFWK